MSDQNFASSVARLEEIADSIRHVLGGQRLWLTPEEFLSNIEAHRRAHDSKKKPKPYDHSKCEVVEYKLKRYFMPNRQREFNGLEVAG